MKTPFQILYSLDDTVPVIIDGLDGIEDILLWCVTFWPSGTKVNVHRLPLCITMHIYLRIVTTVAKSFNKGIFNYMHVPKIILTIFLVQIDRELLSYV